MAAQTGSTYFSGTMIDSSRDISISGLGGHIAISGCRLLLLSFGDTSLTSLLLLELQQYLFWICFVVLVNMNIKFRQFQKNHTCLMLCQTTSGAPIGNLIVCILYPLHIQEKS